MDEDAQIAARLRSGSAMTMWGIIILVASLFGTCIVGAATTSHDPYGGMDNASQRGYELGQNPILLLAIAAGVALIAVGQAKKSNARRAAEDLWKLRNTQIKVVPDAEAPGGPFRGGMKEVAVLDPTIEAIEKGQREIDHRRGNTFLIIGGVIMLATVGLMLLVATSGSGSASRDINGVFTAIGLAFFPFALGMFFAIRGLLLRSK